VTQVFGRFDDHALAALQAAQAEATGLGHNYLGTEHLLLGIVTNPDTAAAHLLAA
jgi:ATP-dependent Clp protease ATP-binding subunit ClpC